MSSFPVAHMIVEVDPADHRRGDQLFFLANVLISLRIHTRGLVNQEVGARSLSAWDFSSPIVPYLSKRLRSLGR
jgi:hypothetical protein